MKLKFNQYKISQKIHIDHNKIRVRTSCRKIITTNRSLYTSKEQDTKPVTDLRKRGSRRESESKKRFKIPSKVLWNRE